VFQISFVGQYFIIEMSDKNLVRSRNSGNGKSNFLQTRSTTDQQLNMSQWK